MMRQENRETFRQSVIGDNDYRRFGVEISSVDRGSQAVGVFLGGRPELSPSDLLILQMSARYRSCCCRL